MTISRNKLKHYQRQIDRSDVWQIDAFERKQMPDRRAHGFILFIKEVERPRVRIFYTEDVIQELSQWQGIDPESFILLFAMLGTENDLERIKRRFKPFLRDRDWYEYTSKIYQFLVIEKYGRRKAIDENKVPDVPEGESPAPISDDEVWARENLSGLYSRAGQGRKTSVSG